ncbi:hypothetical protein JCM6882_002501 [Rhodosporidiobolus microsporus]
MAYQTAAPHVPPEILLHILHTSSKQTLLSASRVSRSWRGPAQELLESRLSLPTPKVARAWLACPGRKTRTRRLSLGAGLTRDECERVFETVEGLEELAVVGNPAQPKLKFDARALQSKQLAGLRQLYLIAPLTDSSPAEPLNVPFSLTHLTCKGLYRGFPPSTMTSLVLASQKTLTSLDLDAYGSNPSAAGFIRAFAPLANTVQSIEVHGSDRLTPALTEFLASCTSLASFTCWEAPLALLEALPASVKNLEIGKDYVFHSEAPYEELLVRSGLLRQIETVRFGGISVATLRAQAGGADLIQECKERGIEVDFGKEVSGRWGTLCYGWPFLGGKVAA